MSETLYEGSDKKTYLPEGEGALHDEALDLGKLISRHAFVTVEIPDSETSN